MYAAGSTPRQFITIEGDNMGYVTAGNPDKPPIIFIHGWLSHADIWQDTLALLQDNFYCIAVDLMGHGYSDKSYHIDLSISAQGARVVTLADSLGFETFTLVGHSMGGMIALHLAALSAPERVAGVVSVAGAVNGQLDGYINAVLKPIMHSGYLFPIIYNFSRLAIDRGWRWYTDLFDRALYHDIHFIPVDTLDRRMAILPGMEVAGYMDLVEIARVNLTGWLSYIDVPVRAIFGRYDKTVPPINGELVAEYVPHGDLVLIENCGHVPMIEGQSAYFDALWAFLCGADRPQT